MTWGQKHAAWLIAAVAFSLPAAGLAQPRVAVPADRWNVDYGELRCSLGRRLGGPQSPIVILTSYLGRDEPQLILMRDGKEPLPELPDRVQVVLTPANQVENARVHSRLVQGGRIFTLKEIGEGFMDRFAASESVSIQARGRHLAVLRTPGAAAAVKALRACNDDLLRSWDVPLASTYSREAKRIAGSFSDFDYPPGAMYQEQSGSVVARFSVDVNGQVTSCAPVIASRFPVLNAETCNVIMKRFRYEPALDLEGKPVAAVLVTTVIWKLQEDE